MSEAYVKYLGRHLYDRFMEIYQCYLSFCFENNSEFIKDVWESRSVKDIRRTVEHFYNGQRMTLKEILRGDLKLAYEVKFEFENCLEKYKREMGL